MLEGMHTMEYPFSSFFTSFLHSFIPSFSIYFPDAVSVSIVNVLFLYYINAFTSLLQVMFICVSEMYTVIDEKNAINV